jgi:Tfp pilus assembly protein PilO
MKFSKTGLLILGIGILIIAAVLLYMAYSQFASQREALFTTINAAQNRFAQVSGEKRSLEPQLTQLQQKTAELKSAYDKARGEFPNVTIQSIEVDEELSNLAEDASVKVKLLTATDGAMLKEGNLTYAVTDFTAEVTGNRVNILDFLHRVAVSPYFKTATINTLDLTEEPTPTPEATDVPEPVDLSTMSMAITIYRYEGN